MPVATVSSKGQITLPAESRRSLGIEPNDRVLIEVENDGIVVRPVRDFFELEGFLGKALPAEVEKELMIKGATRGARGKK